MNSKEQGIVGKGELHFSPVENLDDPRESSLGWIDTVGLGTEVATKSWRKAKDLKKLVEKKLRILCTAQPKPELKQGESPIESSIYGRPRMWYQYGEKFKGFCINLNKEALIKTINSYECEDELVLHDSVCYPPWLHIVQGGATIEYGQEINLDNLDLLNTINNNRMLKSIYFKKGHDWAEEYEYRWLYYSKSNDKIRIDISKCIHSIVLGNKFPTERFEESKKYCRDIQCDCYILDYCHPKYSLLSLYNT